MASQAKFRLALKGLPQGKFEQEYALDNSFFVARNSFDLLGGSIVVKLEGMRTRDTYDLTFKLRGDVLTLCTRCETELCYPITTSYHIVVTLGDTDGGDGDEQIIVARENPNLVLDDLLYSFVVLSIPLRHVHPKGKCSPEVEKYLSQEASTEVAINPFGVLLDKFPIDDNSNNT